MKSTVSILLLSLLLTGRLAAQTVETALSEPVALNSWSDKSNAQLLAADDNGGEIAGDTTKKSEPTGVTIVDSLIGDIKTPVRPKGLSWKAVAIPSGMIVLGTAVHFSGALQKANLFVREELYEDRRNQNKIHLDNYTLFAPAVAVYALNLSGVHGKNNFVDRSIMYGMSNLIANGLVFSTKSWTGVMRPDSSDKFSFPSGHTAEAFVSAEFLRQEFKDRSPWYGVAGYATAVATGVLRMYNNKHWLNDVIVGAGVGILSVRLSYWLYPVMKNAILKKTGKHTKTMIMPTYQNGAVGVGMVTNF